MEKNNDIELINRLSRKKLNEDEVYIFPVTLCDNEIDRDFESFTVSALNTLKNLFIGKTGISDHSMRSSDQTARIFKTWIEEDSGRITQRGEKYTALKARAYMVKTLKNEDLIKEIDAGIKKEVSVACSVGRHTCSICGKERCHHIKGERYDGKLCYTLLDEATDAYEWSFVAVPAQREAGVTKAFNKKEKEKMENPVEIIKSAVSDDNEKQKIFEYIEKLENEASDGRAYKSELVSEVKKLFGLALPELSPTAVDKLCEKLDTASLRELKTGLTKKKEMLFPVCPQTAVKEHKTNIHSDKEYLI